MKPKKPNKLRAEIKSILENFEPADATELIVTLFESRQGRQGTTESAPPPTKTKAPKGMVLSLVPRAPQVTSGGKPILRDQFYSADDIAKFLGMEVSNVYNTISKADPGLFPFQEVKNTGRGPRLRKVYLGRAILQWQERRRRSANSASSVAIEGGEG